MRIVTDRSGNVAFITALIILPILTLVLLGMELGQQNSARTHIQQIVDQQALRAANLMFEAEDLEGTIHTALINEMEQKGFMDATASVTINEPPGGREVEITLTYAKDSISPLSGNKPFMINVESHAKSYQSSIGIELALVLDVSNSMKGWKLKELKTATIDLIETLMAREGAEKISISLIPYAGGVNTAALYPTKLDEKPNWTGCWHLKVDELQKSTPDVLNWDEWMSQNGSAACPNTQTQVIPHSKDKDAMIAAVDGWSTKRYTGTDIGTAWGLWLLSPDIKFLPNGNPPLQTEHPVDLGMEFPDRPTEFNMEHFAKVMIIMTDGAITSAVKHNGGARYSKKDAKDNFLDLCEAVKAQEISLHTVYFGNGSNEDMKTCSGEENYHEADQGDLADIFLEISIGEIDVMLTY